VLVHREPLARDGARELEASSKAALPEGRAARSASSPRLIAAKLARMRAGRASSSSSPGSSIGALRCSASMLAMPCSTRAWKASSSGAWFRPCAYSSYASFM